MIPSFEDYRVIESEGQWCFQVAVVIWPTPHTPELRWTTFRKWKRPPAEPQIARAQAAARINTRFFRTCSLCGELHNVGHMHGPDICQSCAEQHLGVVY